MISMGDEVRRTQRGNNNAYCQDSEISWFDWTLVDKHADVLRFVRGLNAQRLTRSIEHERQRLSLSQMIREATKSWHGVKVGQPDWGEQSHSLALSAVLRRQGIEAYLILNAYWEPLDFELPAAAGPGGPWRRWIDTSLACPQDIGPWQEGPACSDPVYRTGPRSVVVLARGLVPTKVLG
jgi:glycogen operon protein